MFGRLYLILFVAFLSSNECFGNGHPNNEINRNEIEIMKLWKELEKTKEKIQTLTTLTEPDEVYSKCVVSSKLNFCVFTILI
jgi:hypothetical protein